jgi:plasmid stabilization system protein ParE
MERYLRRLYLRIDAIKHNPSLGQQRPDLGADLRCLTENSHIIFYTFNESRISVVAVLHQAMDVGGQLGQ